jgi:hypothetical protein
VAARSVSVHGLLIGAVTLSWLQQLQMLQWFKQLGRKSGGRRNHLLHPAPCRSTQFALPELMHLQHNTTAPKYMISTIWSFCTISLLSHTASKRTAASAILLQCKQKDSKLIHPPMGQMLALAVRVWKQ